MTNQTPESVIAEVIEYHADTIGTHYDGCYKRHAVCLAVKLRDMLREPGVPDAATEAQVEAAAREWYEQANGYETWASASGKHQQVVKVRVPRLSWLLPVFLYRERAMRITDLQSTPAHAIKVFDRIREKRTGEIRQVVGLGGTLTRRIFTLDDGTSMEAGVRDTLFVTQEAVTKSSKGA